MEDSFYPTHCFLPIFVATSRTAIIFV
jgi:hypothetical protein